MQRKVNMALWLIRGGRDGQYEKRCLDSGVACFGWFDVDLSTVNTRAGIKQLIEEVASDRSNAFISNAASQSHAFANLIESGDLIVMPRKNKNTLAIGIVTGPYSYDQNDDDDVKATREVDWKIEDYSRDDIGKDLQGTLNAPMTICRIGRNNTEDRVRHIIDHGSDPGPSLSSSWLADEQLNALLSDYLRAFPDGTDEYSQRIETAIGSLKEHVLGDVPDVDELIPVLEHVYKEAIEVPLYHKAITEHADEVRDGIELISDSSVSVSDKVTAVLSPDGDFHVKGLGPSFWSLFLIAHDPENCPYWNNKTENALKYLGLVERLPTDCAARYQAITDAQLYLKELSAGMDLVRVNHFMHFVIAEDQKGREKVERWKIRDRIGDFIALVRRWHPDFNSVENRDFVDDEITYKLEASRKANELLGKEEFSALVAQEDYEEVISRLKQIGHSTNLLYLSTPDSGDLAVLHCDQAPKREIVESFFDLLWGEGDSVARLARYFSRIDELELPNKWVTPTYYLFLFDPESEYIVKPSATKWLLDFFGAPFSYSSKTDSRFYAKLLSFLGNLRDELSDYGVSSNLHIQSLAWEASRADKVEPSRKTQRIWWVNDGQTWQQDVEHGTLWTNLVDTGGKHPSHWARIREMSPGNIIVLYANSRIGHVGKVVSEPKEGPRQYQVPWDEPEDGFYVDVDFEEVTTPLGIDEVLELIGDLDLPHGPLNRDKKVSPGFIYELTRNAFRRLENRCMDLEATSERQYWWLNKSWKSSEAYGVEYLWVPDETDSRSYKHRGDIASMKVGDIVLKHTSGSVVAVSRVLSTPARMKSPSELSGIWEGETGNVVDLQGHVLEEPIPYSRLFESVSEELKAQVLKSDGAPSGYLIKRFTRELWQELVTSAPELDIDWRSIPGEKGAFSNRSFELLQQLHEEPTRDYYDSMKADFKEEVEQPLQEVLRAAAERLPDEFKKYLETEKRLFSHIPKNDYGRGGAWEFYWGALYTKGKKRTESAQLYMTIDRYGLCYGFSVSDYGDEYADQLRRQLSEKATALKGYLTESEEIPGIRFGWEHNSDSETMPNVSYSDKSLADWIANIPSELLKACVYIPRREAIGMSVQEMTGLVGAAFEKLFPLVIIASFPEPLPILKKIYGAVYDPEPNPEYSIQEITQETGYASGYISEAIRAIRRKGQGILYGPPGTGKTFLAQRLARHLIGGGVGFTEVVQFHPSYTYENFIEGLRPRRTDCGGLDYRLEPGRFKRFCDKARMVDDTCVFIIDEINRANLSRVFGELMFLLEYRNESVPLAGGSRFTIPTNVLIIGTMNTADRSIALVDHALRRRFAFLHMQPEYAVLRYYHSSRETGFDVEPLVSLLREINREIDDINYEVGISFFLHSEIVQHLADIWQMEIEPYLEEYFFDRREVVEKYRWERVREKLEL